jgi:hypothetical protein
MRDQWGMSNVLKVSLQARVYMAQAGLGGGSPVSLGLIERPLDDIWCGKPAISTARKSIGRKSRANPWRSDHG